MASISDALEVEIQSLPEGAQDSWRLEMARALAREMDAKPNASMARELRSVMKDVAADLPASVEGDLSDDLASKRRARIAAASTGT